RYLMMGNGGTNEKGKAPVSADSASSRGISPPSGLTILEGNVDEDAFDSLLDMTLTFADLEDLHRSAGQGIPETVANPRGSLMNSNSFQNPQINMSSNTVNANLQGVSLLPDWNMSWGQQSLNQKHNAVSVGDISTFGGESNFASYNTNRESEPVHTRNNAGFNQSQSGIQGNFADGFLSLRLGGTEESVSESQVGSRDISKTLKEIASDELTMDWASEARGQTLDAGFMGFQSNNSGFSNQFCYENQMTSTNNEVGFNGSLNSWPGSSLQQNNMQHDKNIRPGDLDHLRDEKLKQAVSTELKMIHARKATGQSLTAGVMGFQSNTSGFSNRFSNVDGMNLTNNEVGVHSTINRGLEHTNLCTQELLVGILPSDKFSLYPFLAGQVISQNATPSQVHGVGSNMFSQRTAAPKVSWVESGPSSIDEPFPKRLGVEFNVRNSLQSNQRHLSPMGTTFHTTSTGQICQFPGKGLTRLTDHVLRPSAGRTDGAPVSYPINTLQPFFAHGQSHNVPIQLAKDPKGAPSVNASNVTGQLQKPDLHIRPPHKRSAVVPHPASPWVQRQKINHPTVNHSMRKPYIPVTTAQVHPNQTALVHPNQTAQVHPSIPVGSHTKPADPVAARIRPVIPRASIVRTRVPIANSPAASHITSKVPEATPKLSGYKCFLCKRDLALTSEGPVYQPTAPPPVAILPCGHSFHDQCLQNITPDDQAKDPPCIPCAIGEH
ncbi:hypothetical protein M8C21_016315, partial [Ambrosia artemisiifolia]